MENKEIEGKPSGLPHLDFIPRYVLLHNAISRSAHCLSATAQKLTLMAMAVLPPDLSSLTATFTLPEFCEAMGLEKGGKTYTILKNAINECMECVIMIETGQNKKGIPSWEKFHWFLKCSYNADSGMATMEFSPTLAAYLLASKWVYSKLNLADIGKLNSRYAINIYKIAVSYMSLKGTRNNQYDRWYFERTIQELRYMLNVPEGAYKNMIDFRRKVIESPVKEINNAGIGIEIVTEGIKKGRNIDKIRFNCQKTYRKLSERRGKRRVKETVVDINQPELPGITPELNVAELLGKYPEELVRLYEDKIADPTA